MIVREFYSGRGFSRVSSTKKEAAELRAKSVAWSFRGNDMIHDILKERIDWLECIGDFEICSMDYFEALNPVSRPS
jgi:hypothetical protein